MDIQANSRQVFKSVFISDYAHPTFSLEEEIEESFPVGPFL